MTNPDPNANRPGPVDAYAPPQAPPPTGSHPLSIRHDTTPGQRIAGAVLIANAIIVGLEMIVMPHDPMDKSGVGSPGSSVIAPIIDVFIGFSLIAKNKGVLPWAIVRVALGLVIFGAMHVLKGDMFLVVMQMAVSGSLLLLLIGEASKPRIAIGTALFGVYGLLSVVGIGATVTGKNPLAALIQTASGDIEQQPAGIVTGDGAHYQLKAPSDKWHLRKPEAAKKDNPLADKWLTRPDVDAHVLVIAEKVPGMLVSPDALTDVVIDNAKKSSTKFALLDRNKLRTHPEEGRILHTQSTVNGLDIESLTGVIAYYERGYQIVAFAPRVSFASVESDLRSIVESFELPTDERPGAPADCEPTQVTRVEGVAQKYALTAPGELWFLRKDEAAKKDNALADRWLVRPDKDAHILVVAEEVPGSVVDPDRYTDAITDVVKTNLGGTVLSREELKSQPKIGRLLHAKATVNGMQLEYYYGLFAEGSRAFQVIAFAREEVFEKMSGDFRKTIEGFEMPGLTQNVVAPKR